MENSQLNLNAPRWNMSSIYSGFKNQDYIDALKQLDIYIGQLRAVCQKASLSEMTSDEFSPWLVETLIALNHTLSLYHSLSCYCYCIYSTDTTNSNALNALSSIEAKYLEIQPYVISYRDTLLHYENFLPQFFKQYPQYSDYEYIFSQDIIYKKHEMNLEMENLVSDMQRFSSDSWSKLQEQLISTMTDFETGKTFNELRNDAYSADKELRRNSYFKEISLLKQNQISFAACLNNIKGETIMLNKRRNWNNALEKARYVSRVSEKTLDALIGAIEDSLPFWRDYLKTKAKILNQDKLSFYDLFAPLPKPDTQSDAKIWTFDDAKKYIMEKFTAFSEDLGNFAKKAFAENFIDAEVRKGKVGGGYDEDFHYNKTSRILTNFTGTFSDVMTLAHELGHAYHHYCAMNQDFAFVSYPMTLAETASIFCENIVMKAAIDNSTGYEKASLLETHLSDSCQVLVDILCRFYFEKSVFEERGTKDLGAEDFCNLMLNAQEKTYGDALNENRHPYIWAVKCHYYSSSIDFYNYPYAFGLLFGLGLLSSWKKEGKKFTEKYKEILKLTGKLSCEEVCKQAGFDIESKEFWKTGIDSFKSELEELKLYANC